MRRALKLLITLTLVLAFTPTASRAAPWAPTPGTTWQWQLSGTINAAVAVPVFDIDGFDSTAALVTKLHGQGKRAICYLDMGGAESYRPDYALYPKSVLGKLVDGWPDERWVDIRQITLLQPIITSRFDMCKAKGFDAIEADLADAYANDTGFPITQAHQLAWNAKLASEAHARGMSIALKNAPELVTRSVSTFDFVIVEECVQYRECGAYRPFLTAGKAVLHAEYRGTMTKVCGDPQAAGFSTMKKRLSLNAWRQPCP